MDKERLVNALTQNDTISLLQRSREGVSTIRNLHLELFVKSPSDWTALILKQQKAKEMLSELEHNIPSQKEINTVKSFQSNEPSIAKANSSTNDNPVSVAVEDGGRKRKRRRNNKGKQDSNVTEDLSHNASDNEDVDNEPVETEKVSKNSYSSSHHSSTTKPTQISTKPERPHDKEKKRKHSHSHQSGDHHRGGPRDNVSNSDKADMKKIKFLKSGNMMSSKKLLEAIGQSVGK
jgi:hypothetical protein